MSFGMVLVLVLMLTFSVRGQTVDAYDLADIVFLDSVVVTAAQGEFSTLDFIGLVLKDESFYKAFRNLRQVGYTFETEMQFYDRQREEVTGTYHARHRQTVHDSCRSMHVLEEQLGGDIKKKRKDKFRYYTATLYDRLFLYEGEICDSRQDSNVAVKGDQGMNRHIEQLKKLIFSPGSDSDVPFIGNKTQIFSERMRKHYTFHIRSEIFQDQIEAYIFEARLKEPVEDHLDRTVVKKLTTSFSKDDFQVLGRKYELIHHTLLYDFEVSMDIRLNRIQSSYFPVYIGYVGFWNVPFHRKEVGQFTLTFDQFDSNWD